MIRHLAEVLRMGIDYEQSNWAALLPRVVFSINNSVAAATGFSPFYVERGRDPLIPLDRDKAILDRVPEREDTREFVARIWNMPRVRLLAIAITTVTLTLSNQRMMTVTSRSLETPRLSP